jgi:hypothetical protein
VFEVAISKDEYSLPHVAQLWIVPVDAVDYDRARHAVEVLTSALSVRMGVIPVQSWWGVGRYDDLIVQGFSRHRHHGQHVVLPLLRRNVQAMEVQIAHIGARACCACLIGTVR